MRETVSEKPWTSGRVCHRGIDMPTKQQTLRVAMLTWEIGWTGSGLEAKRGKLFHNILWFFECSRPLAHGHGPGDATLHGAAIQPARERHRSGVGTQRPSPCAHACSGKGKAPRLRPLDGHLLFKEGTVRTGHAESEPVAGMHTKDCDPQD